MMSLFWIAYLCVSHAWAQDAMTFDSLILRATENKPRGVRSARDPTVMPTPMCLPARFSHHQVSVLQPRTEHEKNKDDAPKKRA